MENKLIVSEQNKFKILKIFLKNVTSEKIKIAKFLNSKIEKLFWKTQKTWRKIEEKIVNSNCDPPKRWEEWIERAPPNTLEISTSIQEEEERRQHHQWLLSLPPLFGVVFVFLLWWGTAFHPLSVGVLLRFLPPPFVAYASFLSFRAMEAEFQKQIFFKKKKTNSSEIVSSLKKSNEHKRQLLKVLKSFEIARFCRSNISK